MLDGKRLVITGVVNRESIAYEVARQAQEAGAEIVLTSFGRVRRMTERAASRLPQPADVLELDVDDPAQLAALRDAVVESLAAGIDAGGATIDDFRQPDGARGSFQDRFLVHRRAGEPCATCGREIVKRRVAQRGTYVCEGCQPRPRRSRTATRGVAQRSPVG